MKLFKIYVAALFLLTLPQFYATGQNKEDVVYVNGGSVIRGIILPDSTGRIVRILNHSGDIWVFSRDQVDSIKHEKPFDFKTMLFNKAGFEYGVNAELLVRSGSNAIGNGAIPGINTALGYRINPFISAGVEMGLEFFEWMEIPLSATVRFRSADRPLSPVAFLRLGYTFPAEERADEWDYKYVASGGVHSTIGAGIEKIINKNTAFLLTFAYHYQELNYQLTPLRPWVQERDRKESYSRLRVSLGYVFK